MKKSLYLIVVLLVLLGESFTYRSDGPKAKIYHLPKGVSSKDYLPNTLIIKYKDNPIQTIKTFGTKQFDKVIKLNITYQKPFLVVGDISKTTLSDQKSIDKIGLNRIYQIGYSDQISVEAAINEVLKDTTIEYAEPSFVYYTTADPNDPSYANGIQNYLTQVKASQAWTVQPNANGVIIAIVDSGSDLEHLDLAGNIHHNTADPINGIDDDGDGYVDNYNGWDFVGATASNIKEDNNPDIPADSLDHGVHVSGLASAVTNNGVGIASIAQTAKLMILKVGADDNGRAIYRGYDGIVYAANHGAKIINCSWGGPGGGAFGQDVINYAVSKGCLVVVAAGNDGNDEKGYPAAYQGAFADANVKSDDVKSSSSSYGYHVAIASPGSSIYSTINADKYGYKSGTSMATPIVSSAAALVLAKNPTLSGIQVGEILRQNTDDIYGLSGNSSFINQLGTGRLNVYKALTATIGPSIRKQSIIINDQSNGSLAAGDTLSYYFNLKNVLKTTDDIQVGLTCTNSSIKILNPIISTGTFAADELKKVGPFKVVLPSGLADNSDILFQLNYQNNSTNYAAKEFFVSTVNLDYQNITVNKVYTTITSNGRVGYSGDNATNGLGFIYKDFGLLFEGALMIGNDETHVSNNARGLNGNSNNDFYKVSRVAKVANTTAAYEGFAVEDDRASTAALNVQVKTRQIAYTNSPDDKYVIVEYEVFNKSTLALNNVYVGLFTDWDVDEGIKNITKYDSGLKMGYVYATTPLSPYAGVKLLSGNANPAFYPLSYQIPDDPLADGSFTIKEKYQTLSSGIKAVSLGTGSGVDVMFTIGNGPYQIPASSSVKVAFAFIAGDDLTDISNSALAAQAKYTTVLTAVSPDNLAAGFIVSQNYPNPATSSTKVEILTPKSGKLNLEVYDLTGRKISTIYNQQITKGTKIIEINTSNLNSGIYFYKVSFEGLERVMKMIVMK
ncbi:MAG: S8 family peptidase [Bacteroidetes bacterium]|nr:S8 family peptidase [Bacteroidota bacterium]